MILLLRQRTCIVILGLLFLLTILLLLRFILPCKTVPSTAIPNVVPEVKTSTLVIALTFDDGPDPEGTPAVLQVLSKHQAKATFFMIGKQAEKYPDLVRRVHLEGHEIGNHGYLHSYSLYRNVSKAMKDIEETQNLIYRLTGRRPALYRPPGGYISEELALALAKKSITVVTWSWIQDTKDWRSPPADIQAGHILHYAKPGQILIFHDGGPNRGETIKTVDICLAKLASQGYRFVTVSELIQMKGN